MELTFPFKNIAVNTLLEYLKRHKYDDFVLIQKDEYPYAENYFDRGVEHYKSYIENYEKEIQQTLHTTSQSTIDTYFNRLSADLEHIIAVSSPEHFVDNIRDWNQQTLDLYREAIEKSEAKFHQQDGRKRKHLEKYESVDIFAHITGRHNAPKIQNINYNFYCVEETLKLSDESYLEQYLTFFSGLYADLFEVAAKYGRLWNAGELRSKLQEIQSYRPVVYFEGTLDVDYVRKAAELLGHEDLLAQAEITVSDGAPNMDNLWRLFTGPDLLDIPRKKVLVYDCDTNKNAEQKADVYKVAIPMAPDNPIKKGIENLFTQATVDRILRDNQALIDTTEVKSVKRGTVIFRTSYEVDTKEKRNLCNWLLRNGSKEDFEGFEVVFAILRDILSPADADAAPTGE
jgi:hypothetical protein